MAYVNPQTGFTTKPNFPQILSNIASLIQQKQAQGMANKQFEMQMQRDKARFDATMELETKKLEQAVKDAEARNKFTELQMKLMQLEEDRRVKEEEAMAAFGEARKGAFAPKEVVGTSPLEQGTARVQDYLKNVPQEGGLFGKIAGVLQGAPQVFAEQTQRQTAAPTYGSVGELGLAMLQQTDDPAVINKIMEMYPSTGVMDYQAYKSAIDAALAGMPLPSQFSFAQDYVNKRRELDEKLRLGQIDQVDYNSQMLPLQLEGLKLDNQYKEKLLTKPTGPRGPSSGGVLKQLEQINDLITEGELGGRDVSGLVALRDSLYTQLGMPPLQEEGGGGEGGTGEGGETQLRDVDYQGFFNEFMNTHDPNSIGDKATSFYNSWKILNDMQEDALADINAAVEMGMPAGFLEEMQARYADIKSRWETLDKDKKGLFVK